MEQFTLSLVPENQVYSVSEFNASVRATLESEFGNVRVAGEISGVRLATSGHCYFTLKEKDSTVRCVCYRSAYRYLKFKPQDGVAVVVRGQLSVFEARGEYQIQVEAVEPQGAGALQVAFEELKKKLAAEGLFDAARKRKPPPYPERIGVVTSPQGAVFSDIVHVLERRFPGLQIRLHPALVQGQGSIEEVCAGIEYFSSSNWADVLIVARGGGSIEDLWTFNTELVARAIAACPIPVISAIGHETDVTIADFVADLRAPTPSAAAELVCRTQEELLQRLNSWESRLSQTVQYRLTSAENSLRKRGVEQAASTLNRAIARHLQSIDDYDSRMKQSIRDTCRGLELEIRLLTDRLRVFDQRPRLERAKSRLALIRAEALRINQQKMAVAGERVERATAALALLSPFRVLERGYSVVTRKNGAVIKDAANAGPGAELHIRMAKGSLDVVVTKN